MSDLGSLDTSVEFLIVDICIRFGATGLRG